MFGALQQNAGALGGPTKQLTMSEFLFYWTPEQIHSALELGKLPHAGSNQFGRVEVGDRVWIVGRITSDAEIYLIGWIDVNSVVGANEAQAEMWNRISEYQVWPAHTHLLAQRGRECRTKVVALRPSYRRLEFESKESPRLTLKGLHPNPQQLRSMRKLTRSSSQLLRALWKAVPKQPTPSELAKVLQADLDQLDAQRLVLTRLEQSAVRCIILDGRVSAPCAFCGRTLPVSMIVAAHIKPRSACTLEEKKQVAANVLALCQLGCDSLFENGYIEVVEGCIALGQTKPLTTSLSKFTENLIGRRVNSWNAEQERYFEWRRSNRGSSPAT